MEVVVVVVVEVGNFAELALAEKSTREQVWVKRKKWM